MYIIVYKLQERFGQSEFDWQVYETMDPINELLEDFGDTIAYYSIYEGKLIKTTL